MVPGENGRLGRVLAGLGAGPDAASTMWALAGLADMLPEGSYRLDPVPEGAEPTRLALGWALATYAFARYHAKPASGAALVWPAGADRGRVERLARAAFLARDLTNTPAGDLGPEELAQAAVRVAEEGGACHRVIVGDDLLGENYPTIHAVGRASTRPPRLVDLVWGDPAAPKVTLVGKGVCFDTGGLDLKPASGMRLMKKDMGGCGDRARARPGDHGRKAAGAVAGAAALRRELGVGQCDAADGHYSHAQGPDRRDRQHRCRGPADPVRRAGRGLDRDAGNC